MVFLLVMYDSYSLSESLLTLEYGKVLYFSHPNMCINVSHCDFKLHFPNDYDIEYLFTHLLVIYISTLVKCSNLLPIFYWLYFLLLSFRTSFIFWIHILYQIQILKYFLPVCGLSSFSQQYSSKGRSF